MKAPKKIFVYIPDDDIVGTASTQKGFPHQFVTEEFIRTDALIEKVKEWLDTKDDKDYYTIGYIKNHFQELIKETGL